MNPLWFRNCVSLEVSLFLKHFLKSIINTEHSLTSLLSPIAKEVVGIILIIPITIASHPRRIVPFGNGIAACGIFHYRWVWFWFLCKLLSILNILSHLFSTSKEVVGTISIILITIASRPGKDGRIKQWWGFSKTIWGARWVCITI